jgi:hypothetical protein
MSAETLGQLTITADNIGVPGDGSRVVSTLEDLFELTRADDLGRYRPLTGAKTLPTGWRMVRDGGVSLEEALEVVYPLALIHRRQLAEGTLRVVGLEEVLSRQSGRYEDVAALSPGNRRRARRTVCGACTRQPVWDGVPCGAEDIPCPEPCSVLVAFCREAALWQGEPPATAEADASVPFAAFDVPGNELRERYLREDIVDDG